MWGLNQAAAWLFWPRPEVASAEMGARLSPREGSLPVGGRDGRDSLQPPGRPPAPASGPLVSDNPTRGAHLQSPFESKPAPELYQLLPLQTHVGRRPNIFLKESELRKCELISSPSQSHRGRQPPPGSSLIRAFLFWTH